MGGGGIAAALLLALVLAVLALLTFIAVVLLLVAGFQRRRGREPSPWLKRIALVLIAVVIGVPGVTFTYIAFTNDPDELELDLRSTIRASDLPGDEFPGFPNFYDYDSDRVDLRLPDGERLTTEVDSTVVTVTDERVRSVSIRRMAMPPADARDVVETWAEELDLDTAGLDAAADTPSREWSSTTMIGSVSAKLSVQPTSGGERAIPRLRLEPEQ